MIPVAKANPAKPLVPALYLAGKIGKNDWRHPLTQRVGCTPRLGLQFMRHHLHRRGSRSQAALKPRFLWGEEPKAPDCGSGTRPKKPSQTTFISKPPDFFGLSTLA